ncbi:MULTISPECIES: hypothetical protein [unclassified Bradyrhizobium]|uniref:hypothetical protein n=1 Tax=unclassified Bradyrhizobium TaxID=2631580 RepID=UPI00211F0C79|nr:MULTISPECIES: hypothetical protein [unclassified Bradyrhizobium]
MLTEQIPRSGQLKDVEAFSREVHALLRTCLEKPPQGDAQDRPRRRDLHLRQRDRGGGAQHGVEQGRGDLARR